MRRAISSACTATVIVTLAAAGCTTNTSDRPHHDTPAASPARELTDAERARLRSAEELLVKQCMEAEGFTYWAAPTAVVEKNKAYAYVVDDVAWAKRNGYGGKLAKKAVKARLNDPNLAYLEKLPARESARYDRTLDGDETGRMLSVDMPTGGTVRTPADSCRATAAERLYGSYGTWFRVKKTTDSLTPLYVPVLKREKRFVTALKAWSACMRTAGHPYADPPAVRAELEELTDGLSDAEAHAVEVELAVDEATCAQRTSLADTARALEGEYRAEKLPRRYREAIATRRQLEAAALDRAEDITGSRH
ncbi:hypothetical protein [Streptomyces chartreusis]|uniref:hypothetical protein n=1 Tax=Streptomyces chartreusis TaxID=1969 RepID=UPI0033B7B11F